MQLHHLAYNSDPASHDTRSTPGNSLGPQLPKNTSPLLAIVQVMGYIRYVSLAGILAIGYLSRPMIRIRYAMARVVANKG